MPFHDESEFKSIPASWSAISSVRKRGRSRNLLQENDPEAVAFSEIEDRNGRGLGAFRDAPGPRAQARVGMAAPAICRLLAPSEKPGRRPGINTLLTIGASVRHPTKKTLGKSNNTRSRPKYDQAVSNLNEQIERSRSKGL
jgi:hypothetical protein